MPKPKLPVSVADRLRAATVARLVTVSIRDLAEQVGSVDGKPIIYFSTLADFARGYPAGRPHTVSTLTITQAEALAKVLGLRLKLNKAKP